MVEHHTVFDHVGSFFGGQIMVMGVIGWIVLGVVCGYIASSVMNRDGEKLPISVGIGVVGAVIGGWLFTTFGAAGGTAFNLWSLLVAVVGAGVCLAVWSGIRRWTARA